MANIPAIWPIHSVIIFDCDSTLTAVDGIDELARECGTDFDVASLTKKAMEGDIALEAVYGRRLGAANPTRDQVRSIAAVYREAVVDGAREVVEALQALGAKVFIVSGGLFEPVRDFGVWLGVPREQIFAVGMEYDQLAGEWWRYWAQPGGRNPQANYLAHEANPLSATSGKVRVIRDIRAMHPGRALLVGDGGSDLEAAEEVELFIGFGGVIFRDQVFENSPVYIRAPTLSPVLPLAFGTAGRTPRTARLWSDGLNTIIGGGVAFGDQALALAFREAIARN